MKQMIKWEVKGMNCVGCANAVNNFLKSKGMSEIHVDFTTDEVSFVNNQNVAEQDLIKGIEGLGYSVGFPDEPKKKGWTLNFG